MAKSKLKANPIIIILIIIFLYSTFSGREAVNYTFPTESQCNDWRDSYMYDTTECWWCSSCYYDGYVWSATCDDHQVNSGFEEGVGCGLPQLTCTETDGGDDPYNKGTCVQEYTSRLTYTDYCTSSTNLIEFSCEGGAGVTFYEYTCPCVDGECIEVTGSCSDTDKSTYPTKDYDQKGTATNSEGVSRTDYCESNLLLIEYYCPSADDITISSENHLCTSDEICEDGECVYVSPVCTDYDGGYDIQTASYVTVEAARQTYTYTDTCLPSVSDIAIREYTCYDGGAIFTQFDCPSGYICEGAKCILTQVQCVEGEDVSQGCDGLVSSIEIVNYLGKWLRNEITTVQIINALRNYLSS